ncbi:MAG: hypothetical protein Q7Q73_07325 [Verrucomicrobiota bacterium JB024]|nr:hypothetical protein [Verrucomicrobiota bacterium JB024]
MKAILPLLVLLCSLAGLRADVDFREGPFTLGPSTFREGDTITIEKVYAVEGTFEPDDQIVVRGFYRLGSHDAASLSLYVTQKTKGGRTSTHPDQQLQVVQGSGPFELRLKVPTEGYAHVSFYPAGGGNGFGCAYFGTRAQMAEIRHWDLKYYLKDEPEKSGKQESSADVRPVWSEAGDVRPVAYTVGPSAFLPGDFIEVESVEASNDDFEKGDTVVVRGRYRLESQEAASILFTVTSNDPKPIPNTPEQWMRIQRGSGTFELRLKLPADGYPHLGFYPKGSGTGFGSLYFGTEDQMDEIKDWDLQSRLRRNDNS